MALNRFSGWLDYPEYYFYWNFHGNNSIFNISAYKSAEMDALIDKARFTRTRLNTTPTVKDFVALCMRDVPGGAAQPADPRRRAEEGGRRLRILVSPRTGLPAVRQERETTGSMPLETLASLPREPPGRPAGGHNCGPGLH